MNKFDNAEIAVTNLTFEKRPDCVDALEKLFWTARGEGHTIKEAYYYAELNHQIKDHNVNELKGPEEIDDEYVKALSQEGLEASLDAGETNGPELAETLLFWYGLIRSWGATPYVSLIYSAEITKQKELEGHEMPIDEALAQIQTIENPKNREWFLSRFNQFLSIGEGVYYSLSRTYDEAEAQYNEEQSLLQFLSLLASTSGGRSSGGLN